MPLEEAKTIVAILLESPLYLTLPLRERLEAVRRVLGEYEEQATREVGGEQ